LVPPVPVPQEDFDFEAALAKFEKADINKVRLTSLRHFK
jgi:hypothetical protein